ncbi:MAG: DUF6580 family putative transport protein [Saprospiraceae bacterium]
MTEKKINARLGILILIVFLVTLSRLVPYLFGIEETFNFSPLAAVALFGGAYFANRINAVLFPLIALWVSNLILDNVFLAQYYDGLALFANWEVYVAILAIIGLGIALLKKVTLPRVIGVSLLASIVSSWQPILWYGSVLVACILHTFEGLVECYVLAVPFLKIHCLEIWFFSIILFGAF